MGIRLCIKGLADELSGKYPAFAKALIKWTPLIDRTTYRVAKLTGQDLEDVYQDLAMDLSNMAKYHAAKLYRYKDSVWECTRREGKMAYIQSPRHNKRPLEPGWVA